MQRLKPIPWSTTQFSSMIKKGTIVFDNPFQRPAGQWDNDRKSLLIYSVYTLFVPDVYAIKEDREVNGEVVKVYDVLEGQQRMTIFSDFRDNKFKLSRLDPFTFKNEEYDISGLYYSTLPQPLKEELDKFTLTVRAVELQEGDDKDEVSRAIFYRLNNGVKVSNQHLAIVQALPSTRNFVHEMVTGHPLYLTTGHFAVGATKNSEPQMTVMQTIALVGGYECPDYGTKSMTNLFASTEIDQEIFDKVTKAFDMLHIAFPDYTKFITKVNLVSFAYFIANNDFQNSTIEFLKHYHSTSKSDDAYRKHAKTGGSTKKSSVENRNIGLQSLYEGFLQGYTVPDNGQSELIV